MAETRHGTDGGYSNHGCRCEECRAAHRAAHAEWTSRRPALPARDDRHGTVNGYKNYACRCPKCTEANRVAQRQKRAARRMEVA